MGDRLRAARPVRRTRADLRGAGNAVRVAARLRHVPAWVFHGDEDDIIPVSESREIVKALRALDAPVRYTEYRGVMHESWDAAYAEQELMPWMLGHAAPE
jgi:predicted peptidase